MIPYEKAIKVFSSIIEDENYEDYICAYNYKIIRDLIMLNDFENISLFIYNLENLENLEMSNVLVMDIIHFLLSSEDYDLIKDALIKIVNRYDKMDYLHSSEFIIENHVYDRTIVCRRKRNYIFLINSFKGFYFKDDMVIKILFDDMLDDKNFKRLLSKCIFFENNAFHFSDSVIFFGDERINDILNFKNFNF